MNLTKDEKAMLFATLNTIAALLGDEPKAAPRTKTAPKATKGKTINAPNCHTTKQVRFGYDRCTADGDTVTYTDRNGVAQSLTKVNGYLRFNK